MKRSAFNTSIDDKIQSDFKAACSSEGIGMNVVLEAFMRAYADGRFRLEIEYERNQLEEK